MVSSAQQAKPRSGGAKRHPPRAREAGAGQHGSNKSATPPQQNNKVINRTITSAAEAGDATRLLETIQLHLHEMNGINLATAFHRVAKLVSGGVLYLDTTRQHPTFQDLFQAIVQHITSHSLRDAAAEQAEANWEMPVQCMSIVSWSCATLQLRHKALCAAIAEISSPRLCEFKPYELSNLLWAFAKLSFSACSCDLFKNVTTRLLRRHDGEFKVQCLSTMAWSFATMKRRILVVFSSLAMELVAHAHEMKPQEISNALWAFAKSRCANAELFQALGDAAVTDSAIWSFKPQELSNTAWAFATVGLQHRALFALIEKVSIRKRHEMVPQNIANILWSFAKLQVQPQSDLYPLLLDAAERTLPHHKPQELSAVVWAAAQACPHGHSAFFVAAAQCCTARLQETQEFSMNGLANLVKAFAVVDMDAPEIFVTLVRVSLPLLARFKPLALCGLFSGAVRAASNLSYSSHTAEIANAVAKVAEHVASQIYKFQPFELQEISDALSASRPGEPAVEQLQELEQEVARARLRLPDAAGPDAKDLPKGRGPPSVGNMSTSAEESQGEDEEEDFKWATSYHPGAAVDEPKAKPCVGREKSASQVDEALAFAEGRLAKGRGAEAAARRGGSKAKASSYVGLPPGLGGHQEAPASSWNAMEGWTPWRVPLLAPGLTEMESLQRRPGPSSAPVKVGMGLPQGLDGYRPFNSEPPQYLTLNGYWPFNSEPPSAPLSKSGSAPCLKKTETLKSVDLTCFAETGLDLHLMQVDPATVLSKCGVYGVEESVFRLRSGHPQGRVVFKRVPVGLVLPESVTVHAGLFLPIAQMQLQGCQYLVYPHCAHGNLLEWLRARAEMGAPVKPEEAARIVSGVLKAAEVLLGSGEGAISAVQPDEIFMGEGDAPLLREPLPGKPGGWQDALKWLSPDETAGRMQSVESTWPALSFRLGMLLYCMGSQTEDPYPGVSGETVLMSLLSEVGGGNPRMRPNMAVYEGPEILRRMVAACLQIDGQAPPVRSALAAVLDVIARELQQHEPMKVSMDAR